MIPEEDLDIHVRRAHAPCGMHVDAGAYVEITHLPTGVSVAVKTGKSQMLDKQLALEALRLALAAVNPAG